MTRELLELHAAAADEREKRCAELWRDLKGIDLFPFVTKSFQQRRCRRSGHRCWCLALGQECGTSPKPCSCCSLS